MDKSQLVTIAVTAIITAFVKEIAGALLSIFKNFATNTTVREKIKTALTPNKITAAINLVLMLFCAWTAYGYVYSPAPLDRFAVFNIAYFTGLAILCVARIDMIIMIHSESISQSRLLPAQIQLEIAKKDATDAKLLRETFDRLNTTLDQSKPSPIERDEVKSLPPNDAQQ